jgi:RNA polymerase sigma-70 factor (ECF subfamily)
MCDDQKAEIAGTFRDCHADLVAFFARQHPDADSAADLAAARRQRARRPVVMDAATLAAVEAPPRDDPAAAARDLIAGLPARQRDVLDLRFVTGLSYAEIAARLDIPVGTVRSRIHHAVALLRSRMPPD